MTDMTLVVALPADRASVTWFGQPKGIFVLFMTEMWERFSFYGMRALLVLYMVQELLLPGHIENVAGMQGFRTLLESMLGPMSTQAFASQVFGLYAGLVYLTPIFGGLLADRIFGTRKVVLAGITLMVAGHFAMAFEWRVLLALTLLVLGSGCLKGNIAAQVGATYPKDDEAGRSQGFTIFSTGTDDLYKIAIGSLLMSVACAILAAGAWSVQPGGAKVTVWYPLVALVVTGISFMWYWPVTLAFVSRHSPPQVNALMMAGAYLVAFFSGIGSGFIARYYEPLGPMNFWLLNAGFGIAGALGLLLFGPALRRWMARLEARAGS